MVANSKMAIVLESSEEDTTFGNFILDVGDALLRPQDMPSNLSDECYRGLRKEIYWRVGTFGARIALLELANAGSQQLPRTRRSYDAMINTLKTERWSQYLVEKYPALLALGTAARNQAANAAHVATAANREADIVSKILRQDSQMPKVIDLTSLGDLHENNTSTLLLTFENQSRILYKPTPAGNTLFVSEVVTLINSSLEFALHVPYTIEAPGGHWQEYLEKRADAFDYTDQYRLGAWLALSDAISLADLHMENIVAGIKGPSVIDYECFPTCDPTERILRSTLPSLSRIGILPAPFGDAAERVDWSVLGGDLEAPPPSWALHEIRDDGLPTVHLAHLDPKVSASSRATTAQVKFQEDALVSGFSHAHDALCKIGFTRLSDLLYENMVTPRLIIRPTQVYQNCLRRSSYPHYMENQNRRREAMSEWLSLSRIPRTVLSEELDYLDQFLIPAFRVDLSQNQILDLPIQTPVDAFSKSYSQHTSPLRKRQACRHIRQSLESASKKPVSMPPIDFYSQEHKVNKIDKYDALSQLTESIAVHAQPTPLGMAWANLERDDNGNWAQASYSPSLYNGTAGIYFALSTAKRTGIAFSNHADLVYRYIQEELTSLLLSPSETIPPGLFDGLSGIAYSLLSNVENRGLADQFLECIRDSLEFHLAHLNHDIISGAAGIILFARRVEALGLSVSLSRQIQRVACGHLAELAHRDPNGFMTWEQVSDWFGGLSHGTAGVMWAVQESSLSDEYSWIIEEALRSQLSLAAADGFSWKTRNSTDAEYLCSWCHGTEGISLVLNSFSNLAELTRKNIAALLRAPLPSDPGLCHGLAGRYMSLVELNQFPAAHTVAGHLWRYALTQMSEMNSLNDGLMNGRSGILFALCHYLSATAIKSPLIVGLE